MNVSYQWLRALAPAIDGTPQQVADRLAQLGAPADAVVPLGAGLDQIISARVVSARKHPNADKLTLCEVDAGTGSMLQVVCGAPNVEAGKVYAFAPVGAELPGGLVIRKAKIRGETSEGMLCSERELGLGRDHAGIWALPGDPQPGLSLIDIAGLDDTRLELDIGPNRPDLLSHAGIAAELAPHGRGGVALPVLPGEPAVLALDAVASSHEAEAAGVRISIEDDGCRRYLAAVVRGVTIAPSPAWLSARLRAVGLRPINNVVDATNYVLYELGQPLHAFDLDRLHGPAIVVRGARAGEKLTTLDGTDRALSEGALVIADADRVVALAGVMGGADSEVTAGTRNLLIECALFDPKRVRALRRALGMSTDASHRFERGVDADGMERALRRVVSIILATAGGTAERAYADVTRVARERRTLTVRADRVHRVLGVDIGAREIADLLAPLGFGVEVTGESVRVDVPGARLYDVEREIDLIEEVARRYGYDRFPDEARAYRPGTVPDDALTRLEDRLRDRLVARGFLESRTVPFAPDAHGDVALALPLSAEESRLRRALLPTLLRRVEYNWARGVDDLRLFEIGTGFAAAAPGVEPAETRRIAFALTGRRSPAHWSGGADAFDLWDLKSLLEDVAPMLGGVEVRAATGGVPTFLGPEVFEVVDGAGRVIGFGGRVHGAAVDTPARIAAPLWGAELLVSEPGADDVVYTPIPVHPAVERDLALLERGGVSAAAIAATIRKSAGELLESVEPFDIFRGGSLAAGSRSIAFRLRFRAPGRTLTDEEVDRAVGKVLGALKEEHGIERR